MPKKPRNGMGPVLDLSDDLPKELRATIRTSTHELIAKYMEWYEQVKGSKPDKNRVVDGSLAAFFQSDPGFQSYLKGGSAKRASSTPASANQPSGG